MKNKTIRQTYSKWLDLSATRGFLYGLIALPISPLLLVFMVIFMVGALGWLGVAGTLYLLAGGKREEAPGE